MLEASPAYWGCPDCGGSEFWRLTGGRLMCANWPECGRIHGTWSAA